MTDELRPAEDAEGQAATDDVEGHGVSKPRLDDDVEGHGVSKPRLDDDDDVEGHGVSKPR